MHTNCVKCLLEQANKLFSKHGLPDNVSGDIMVRLQLFIDNRKAEELSIIEAATFLHRLLKKAAHINDLYKKEKNDYNNLLLELEEDIRNTIKKAKDPFQTALRYALAGNVIDFAPSKSFDVFKALATAVSKKPAIDHSLLLEKELKKASVVLYLGDNAGEIVMDKLFIETIDHTDLYYAVRGAHIINDITLEDAEYVGMTKIANVISNGYDAPSTLLKRCSPEFRKIYDKADIVISKGQGNLEGLIDRTDKKIFFLLTVKCDVMAEMIGVEENDVVVFYNQKISIRESLA